MATIRHQLSIDAPVATVYEAIATAEGCISTHPASSPASAWTGTHFMFELAERGDRTTALDFRQTNYDEHSPFFRSNTVAWGQVLERLKQVVESRAVQ